MIKVLMISTDIKILEEGSSVRTRMIEYGTLFSELHIIVFCTDTEASAVVSLSKNVYAYPTRSLSKVLYVKDAIKVGQKIIQEKGFVTGESVITTQDPFETGMVGRALSKKSNIALHVQIHTDFQSPYFRKSALNKVRIALSSMVLPQASAVRVVSERIQATLLENIRPRSAILPIFADVAEIQKSVITIDLKKKYPQFKKIVLIASRLTKEKDIAMGIRAFAQVLKKCPETGLVIVGSGTEEGTLKKEVAQLHVSSTVVFEPWVDHATLVSYMKTCDVFLSASQYEGYGLSMLEAHTAGAVITATDAGIAPLLTAPEFLVAPGSEGSMVQALLSALGGRVANKSYQYPYASRLAYMDMYKADMERALVQGKTVGNKSHGLFWPLDWAFDVFNQSLFIRYVFSGGTAAAIDVVLLFILTTYFNVYYLAAATFAMTISFIARFLLQKFITFKDTDASHATAQFASYSVLYAGSLIATNALLYLLVDYLHINVVLAQIGTIGLIACVSFFVYKVFVFTKHVPAPVSEVIEK